MLLIYKTNLICLKQLSEAGPGLLLFAGCRSGRLHCGQIFSLFFSSYQPYLSDLHKQRGWVESDSVWYLSFDQTFVSVRQTGLGLGLFASKRKPEYSHPLNKILSVLVIRIKCFEIGYRKHFPQKKMHTFAFTKSWICLFGICVLFLNIFVHSRSDPRWKLWWIWRLVYQLHQKCVASTNCLSGAGVRNNGSEH